MAHIGGGHAIVMIYCFFDLETRGVLGISQPQRSSDAPLAQNPSPYRCKMLWEKQVESVAYC